MDLINLEGKRIGYFVGSLDPFHNGHEYLIRETIKKSLVDYVIVYPVPGRDKYKDRSDFQLRREMIRGVFKTSSNVILTELTPAKMQDLLTPYFDKFKVIGIIGSDVVIDHLSDTDALHKQKVKQVFMRGLKIPEKYADNTIGAIMALPAASFIVSLRNGADLSHLNGMYEDRPICGFIELKFPYSHLSSTKVRKAVELGESIAEMVSPSVEAIIKERRLYNP